MGSPGKRCSKGDLATPGPGSYNQHMPPSKFSPAAYSMGAKCKDGSVVADQALGPGPGAYEPKHKGTTSPAWKMGSPRKVGLLSELNSSPGPGAHEPKDSSYRSPSWKMPGRYKAEAPEFTPGPGHYTNAKITRTGTEMLADASETYARRNPIYPTAGRM